VANIHIEREHTLGLSKARALALQWAEQVEAELDMACTYAEGDTSDTLEFDRSGVSGTLEVTANAFVLDAKLGFLLGAFKGRIESEISQRLDAMLSSAATKTKAPAKKPAAPVAAKTPKAPALKTAAKTAAAKAPTRKTRA
jgi:putative polyhydroxyalkanoate system protein